MKKINFWQSLEQYGWKLRERSPLPYTWIIIALFLMVITSSIFGKDLVAAKSTEEAIKIAAAVGDYALAEQLYLTGGEQVLGASTSLEELIYPERKVEMRINELENKLVEYPGNRVIYQALAKLYGELGNSEKEDGYREMVRVLDPNE